MSLLKRLNSEGVPVDQGERQTVVLPPPVELTSRKGNVGELKSIIQNKLADEMGSLDVAKPELARARVNEIFQQLVSADNIVLSRSERAELLNAIMAEIFGFGPIEPLLRDESVSEIMVNGPKRVYVERKGRLQRVNVAFDNDDHVRRVVDRILSPLGRRVDESSPMVDARLPDGSRVNAIIPPLSLNGPIVTIRKFSRDPFTADNLLRFGSVTEAMVTFLRAAVAARLNVIVSGGTGSGKTTTLNVLSSFIPDDERIVTIENAAELQLQQDHVVTLESRPANAENRGEVTIRDLMVNALRMRPDRIIVGEVRSGEALDMLQAMNTGHDGSMATLHANSTQDALSRLETMVLMAGMELPSRAIQQQIASAIHVIIQQERMRDGSRKITKISEVVGLRNGEIVLNDLFEFRQTGYEQGKLFGRFTATGNASRFLEEINAAGVQLPADLFEPAAAPVEAEV